MAMTRRLVIGDVHGHYAGLMRLLDLIGPQTDNSIFFLGDLIDRGPESARVVEFVIRGGYACLLGNHEDMMLKALCGDKSFWAGRRWALNGGDITLEDYSGSHAELLGPHLMWMQTLPTFLDLGDLFLVHAGVHPNVELEKQCQEEFFWVRDEHLYCRQRYFPDKLIVHGHTPTLNLPGVKAGKLAAGPGWLNIDTGVCYPESGWLTGLDFDKRTVYQVNVLNERCRTLDLKGAVVRIDEHVAT
jgi:serine/threonine protein phosphatase 1